MLHSPAEWAVRLQQIGSGSVSASAFPPGTDEERESFIRNFHDAAGHRRLVDEPLLRRMLSVHPAAFPASETIGERHDVGLMWAALRPSDGPLDPARFISGDSGPLVPHLRSHGIEIWTEAELTALHALSWISIALPAWAPRLESAAAWLVEELQPDNATHRPWAVHVFVRRGHERGDIEASLYAQTLLHNAIISGAMASRAGEEPCLDPFSALILLDSAAYLRAITLAAAPRG